jgi:hypothetical protein
VIVQGRQFRYVGIGSNLRQRITQHLIRRDSSVTTGVTAVSLNPDLVSDVLWWEADEFSDPIALEAAERIASTRSSRSCGAVARSEKPRERSQTTTPSGPGCTGFSPRSPVAGSRFRRSIRWSKGSEWSIGGESQGGAGQWQRRQAEAGSSLGRSTAGGDGSFAFAAGDNNTATATSDGCTIRVADVSGRSGSC